MANGPEAVISWRGGRVEGGGRVVRALPRDGGFPPPPRDDDDVDEGGKARPFCLDDDGGIGCSYVYIENEN